MTFPTANTAKISPSFNSLWAKAKPYLKRGKRKDFVLHTQMVVRAVKLLIKEEGGEPKTLIPAAILHDVGWARVSPALQMASGKKHKDEAQRQHLQKAIPIIRKILKSQNYESEEIGRIIDLVLAHKFTNPKDPEKRLLIDADTLSDTYQKTFISDSKAYGSAKKNFAFRKKNHFYTKAAKKIFEKQLLARRAEVFGV